MDNYGPEVGKVLDFGSGKVPRQTELLRQEGFDVSPYEVYENRVLGVHAGDADVYINHAWDVILMSNVLNVQDTIDEAARLVQWALGRKPRVVIFNLPNDPVYWDVQRMHPRRRRAALLLALEEIGVHPNRVESHPYSGGVVYVIDNNQPVKDQPKFFGVFGSR